MSDDMEWWTTKCEVCAEVMALCQCVRCAECEALQSPEATECQECGMEMTDF